MSNNNDYALGYSEEEFRRLAAQAAFYEDLTEDVLRRAGLRPGMRVLDLSAAASGTCRCWRPASLGPTALCSASTALLRGSRSRNDGRRPWG